jgi:hypothetical protein
MEKYDEIMRILTDVSHRVKTRDKAANEILLLFSVSECSHQFIKEYEDWGHDKEVCIDCGIVKVRL